MSITTTNIPIYNKEFDCCDGAVVGAVVAGAGAAVVGADVVGAGVILVKFINIVLVSPEEISIVSV